MYLCCVIVEAHFARLVFLQVLRSSFFVFCFSVSAFSFGWFGKHQTLLLVMLSEVSGDSFIEDTGVGVGQVTNEFNHELNDF